MRRSNIFFQKGILVLFIAAILLPVYSQQKPYVVMLSLDGFRWDYAKKVATPNFDYIAAHGVKAESLKPSFPTKTFPNHYSIVTGLYPGHHDIVLNGFYDPETNRYYSISNRESLEDGSFYGGEPIWNTAEKQGIKTASFFWVGSEANIQGMRPDYWKVFDSQIPFGQRIDTVVNWLQLPEKERPHLILCYMEEPDESGHDFGPDSKQVKQKVSYLDSLVGVFTRKLNKLPVSNRINFIIVSDHGMTALSPSGTSYLYDYINRSQLERGEGSNPVYFLDPKPESADSVYSALKKAPHINVWWKKDLPERWHLGSSPRVLNLVVVADNGWQLKWDRESKLLNGDHGYDNNFRDMHGIFYAMGPAFRKDYVQPTFENVNIYNIISFILGITPAKNDGIFEAVSPMLNKLSATK